MLLRCIANLDLFSQCPCFSDHLCALLKSLFIADRSHVTILDWFWYMNSWIVEYCCTESNPIKFSRYLNSVRHVGHEVEVDSSWKSYVVDNPTIGRPVLFYSTLIECCFISFQRWGTQHLWKLRLQFPRSHLPQQLLHLKPSRKRRSAVLAQIQRSWETTASCRMARMPAESS